MTVGGLFSASPSPSTTATLYSRTPSITQNTPCPNPSFCSSVVNPRLSFEHYNRLSFSDPKSKPTNFAGNLKSIRLRCNSSTGPGGPPGSGEGDSKIVLDAFFLGKALAEALNERIESTVGEFLSAVGRLQAEQQKQVQDFQEDVLERAKRAKEKAAREAMEAQGLIPKSSTADASAVTNGDTTTSSPAIVPVTPTISPSPSSSSARNTNINADTGPNENEPFVGVPDED